MTINIPLIDGWRILSDKYQFILAKEDGERIIHDSFHSEIEDVVQELLKKKIRRFNAKSIHELIMNIKTLQTRLNKALLPLKLQIVSENEVKNG